MKPLSLLGLILAGVGCFFLGHGVGRRVPLMGGHRCELCQRPVDMGRVNPGRRHKGKEAA